jgi:hypothetical protein
MGNLVELNKRLVGIELGMILDSAVKDLTSEIVELNTRDQLWKGIDSTGKPLPTPYSTAYEKKKRRMGVPTNVRNLFLTGEFYSDFKLEIASEYYRLFSSAEHQKWLVHHYGGDIYGLTPESREKLKKDLVKEMTDKIRQKIGI